MDKEIPGEIQTIRAIVDDPVELVTRTGAEKSTPASHPVFVVDDTFFRSRTPKSPHWSIAWADLMMTMFILFLTMFVYQLAHRQFLSEETPEVVAGTSMPVPQTSAPALPFHPISPTISAGRKVQLKKTEPVAVKEQDIDAIFEGKIDNDKSGNPGKQAEVNPQKPGKSRQETSAITLQARKRPDEKAVSPGRKNDDTGKSTIPAGPKQPPENRPHAETIITRMYDLSKITVADEKLEKFASVELIPDKTMRIVLTGDLLFPSGKAELTQRARESLHKLIPIIRQTPYMINVIGHTDSIPMHSEKFSSNWELSTARAGRVARFLIEDGHIPASHFVVSGYSYFRPVKPNTTAANRRANRRVEIIISKEPPPAQSATTRNLQ